MNVRSLPLRGQSLPGLVPNGSPFGAPLIDPCNITPEPCTLRPLDWARDIQRGNRVTLCQPGEEKSLISIDNGHVQCAETIDIVLTSEICEQEGILDPDSFAWPHVVAHVCWGIGSETFNAWIDVQTGTHFSIVAEMLWVNASYQLCVPPWAKDSVGCLPTFKVKGGLGYGCSKRIQLTQLALAENPGDKCILAVPPFAEAFTVMIVNGGKASVRVLPFGGALGVPIADQKLTDLNPLMGGAESIEFTNTGDVPLAAFLISVLGL